MIKFIQKNAVILDQLMQEHNLKLDKVQKFKSFYYLEFSLDLDLLVENGVDIPDLPKAIKTYSISIINNEPVTIDLLNAKLYRSMNPVKDINEGLLFTVGSGEDYKDFHNNKKTGGI